MTKKMFLPILTVAFVTMSMNNLVAMGGNEDSDEESNNPVSVSTLKKRNTLNKTIQYNKNKHELAEEIFNLGLRLYNKRDYYHAFELFMEAAVLEHVKAQYSVGALYEYGMGTESSFREAGKWYTIAASRGNAEAKTGIERITKKVSSRLYCTFFGAGLPEVTILPASRVVEGRELTELSLLNAH